MSALNHGSRSVTLRDVAKAAGVSLATASAALAGQGRMAVQTRERIVQTAAELKYSRNPLGYGLRTGRTYAIGLHHVDMIRALNETYLLEFMSGVTQVAHAQDHDVALLSSNSTTPRRNMPRVDGIIVMDPLSDDARARELITSGMPVVSGEFLPAGMPPGIAVTADHATAVREILDHVYADGLRSMLLIAPGSNSGWGEALRETVRTWCDAHGVRAHYGEYDFGEQDADLLERLVEPILRQNPDIDFVFTAGAAGVFGAIGAIHAVGRIPGTDVRLACGADGARLAGAPLFITAVQLPAREIGVACAETLLSIVEGDDSALLPVNRTIPAEVIFRQSTQR